ncbi:Propanediol diffusion facilitator [Mycena kentingensis (nom. inval.)]|nr:Propanediol diffusion facilitator [Mycena kentingensis (nom. inval.)]
MASSIAAPSSGKFLYRGQVAPRRGALASWERLRNGRAIWIAECFAEALGVFMYTYAGTGSQAAWVIQNLLKEEGLSSIFQVGWGYAAGIMFAITVCGSTSGAHFNPCITIVHVLFNKFPVVKGIRYILSQIFGAYVACLVIYLQYKHTIHAIEAALPAATKAAVWYTPNGVPGIFANYLLPGSSVGLAFVNEFVADFFIALVIFGVTDPSNPFISPAAVAPVISMAYAAAIWGFALNGLSANTARDLGGRFAALTLWGTDAVGPFPSYCASSALTNIPATILAFLACEVFLVDSDRAVPQASREFVDMHAMHRRTQAAHGHDHILDDSSSASDRKEAVGTIERV